MDDDDKGFNHVDSGPAIRKVVRSLLELASLLGPGWGEILRQEAFARDAQLAQAFPCGSGTQLPPPSLFDHRRTWFHCKDCGERRFASTRAQAFARKFGTTVSRCWECHGRVAHLTGGRAPAKAVVARAASAQHAGDPPALPSGDGRCSISSAGDGGGGEGSLPAVPPAPPVETPGDATSVLLLATAPDTRLDDALVALASEEPPGSSEVDTQAPSKGVDVPRKRKPKGIRKAKNTGGATESASATAGEPAANLPGRRPNDLGVFIPGCVVEVACGEEGGLTTWMPAIVVALLRLSGHEAVPEVDLESAGLDAYTLSILGSGYNTSFDVAPSDVRPVEPRGDPAPWPRLLLGARFACWFAAEGQLYPATVRGRDQTRGTVTVEYEGFPGEKHEVPTAYLVLREADTEIAARGEKGASGSTATTTIPTFSEEMRVNTAVELCPPGDEETLPPAVLAVASGTGENPATPKARAEKRRGQGKHAGKAISATPRVGLPVSPRAAAPSTLQSKPTHQGGAKSSGKRCFICCQNGHTFEACGDRNAIANRILAATSFGLPTLPAASPGVLIVEVDEQSAFLSRSKSALPPPGPCCLRHGILSCVLCMGVRLAPASRAATAILEAEPIADSLGVD